MNLAPDDLDTLARTVWGEARNQSDQGQQAVVSTVLNRVNAGTYGKSIHDVILAPKQFSAWNDPRKLIDVDPNSKEYKRAAANVQAAAADNAPDYSGGATHYYAPSGMPKGEPPSWIKDMTNTANIGGHKFFTPTKTANAEPDLLGSWQTSPTTSQEPSAPVSSEPDLLGSWSNATPTMAGSPQQAIPFKEGETPGESTARWVSEHQANNPVDAAIRFGAGANRGIGNVADTLAQGIGYVGEKGANALSSAGVISPETAANVAQWHAGMNSDIQRENDLWNAQAKGSGFAQAGQIAGQVAGSAPMMVAPGAVLPAAGRAALAARPLLNTALSGAAAGGETSALTSSASPDPLSQQTLTGSVIGGLLGPVGYGLGKGANALAQLSGVDAATARLAAMARDRFGINVGPGQISANPMVRIADSVLQRTPLSGHAADVAARQSAFNSAAIKSMQTPISANAVTPPVMAAVKDHLSNEFETTLPKLEAHLNPNLQGVIQRVTDATDYLPAEDARVINKLKDDVLKQFTGVSAIPGKATAPTTGTSGLAKMDGSQIQAMIAKGSTLDRAINGSSPNVSHYASELKEGLLDAVGQTPTGRPKTAKAYLDTLQRYQTARLGWKNMKTLEPLAEKATTGDISPALLMNEVRKSYGGMAYGGGGDLADLARIGQRFLKEPGSSNTSERGAAMLALGKAGLTYGALAGGAYAFDPEDFQRNALLGLSVLGTARGASSLLRSNKLAGAMIRNAPGMPATPFAQNMARRFNALAPVAAPTYRQQKPVPTFDERFRGIGLNQAQ